MISCITDAAIPKGFTGEGVEVPGVQDQLRLAPERVMPAFARAAVA
jgi:hypothetical protein